MRTNRSGESALLLLDAVELLTDQKIEYAVVGALAASIHGAVRASLDADVVLSIGMREAEALEAVLSAAGFGTLLRRGDFEDPIPGLLRLNDRYGNCVDLLLGLRGMEPQAFARAIDVPFRGMTLKFIGREDFIAMKLFAGGPMDLIDASRAILAGGESLDRKLVRRLAERYGRGAVESLGRLLPAE